MNTTMKLSINLRHDIRSGFRCLPSALARKQIAANKGEPYARDLAVEVLSRGFTL